MQELFKHNTIKTFVDSSSKAIHIELFRPKRGNSMNMEMLFELECILSWCVAHIEVQTVFIYGNGDCFSQGFNPGDFANMDSTRVFKFLRKLRKVASSLALLPQNIVIDLGKGASNLALEFAFNADIIICHEESQLLLDHLQVGLAPNSGLLSWNNTQIPWRILKTHLLTSRPIDVNSFTQMGVFYSSYTDEDREKTVRKLFFQLSRQAPVQRIHLKDSLVKREGTITENYQKIDESNCLASLGSEDWKASETPHLFMHPKQFKEVVKAFPREESPEETL